MKKLIILILLLFASLSFAGSNPYILGSGGVNTCPSFYNATNVVMSWDGDHSSGANYA